MRADVKNVSLSGNADKHCPTFRLVEAMPLVKVILADEMADKIPTKLCDCLVFVLGFPPL